jgi:hypothetical protein
MTNAIKVLLQMQSGFLQLESPLSKPIFPHFYSLETPTPFCGTLIGGNWLFIGNIFIMHFLWNDQAGNTASRGKNLLELSKFKCKLISQNDLH